MAKNETKTITYDFPPKIITIKILNESHESYDIITDPSCDTLGWPAFRQLTHINSDQDINGTATYNAGNITIAISDMGEPSANTKQLTCTRSDS